MKIISFILMILTIVFSVICFVLGVYIGFTEGFLSFGFIDMVIFGILNFVLFIYWYGEVRDE